MARNWAICIGINHYNNMPDLTYAVRDAEGMKNWFEQASFERVYLFTDNSPPIDDADQPYSSQPTYAQLRRFFRTRFDSPFLSSGDNLWFFFSGHGLVHNDRDYLMPIDADPHPDGVENTALTLTYLTERLKRCGADNVVIIYDACRNQQKSKGNGIGNEQQKGVITLASCSPNERSYEIDEVQHGSFTYALLEALQNTQQGQGNYATFDRLYQRLRYRVLEINQHYKKPRQTPFGFVNPDEKRHWVLLPKYATTLDIEAHKKQALNAELNNQLEYAKRLLIRLWEICPGDEEVRQYLERVIVKIAQQPVISLPTEETSELGGKSAATDELSITPPFRISIVNSKGEVIKSETHTARYFTETLAPKVQLDMVYIPGGTFIMGTDDLEIERLCKKYDWEGFKSEKPQHQVTVPPFFMAKYPVTQAQWKAIASNTDLKIERDLKPDPSCFKGDIRPVERVSWLDAVEFCLRLSKLTGKPYRLPTEAEWEYACRAGTTTPFYFGETITTDLANYRGTDWDLSGTVYPGNYDQGPKGIYREETTPVGQFPPNAFGLYDMHGNVWEWCFDDWHGNYEGAPADGSPWITDPYTQYLWDNLDRVNPVNSATIKTNEQDRQSLRGGSWLGNPGLCRSAYRLYSSARDYFNRRYGFRVAASVGRT